MAPTLRRAGPTLVAGAPRGWALSRAAAIPVRNMSDVSEPHAIHCPPRQSFCTDLVFPDLAVQSPMTKV
jgi:hypothetical protein